LSNKAIFLFLLNSWRKLYHSPSYNSSMLSFRWYKIQFFIDVSFKSLSMWAWLKTMTLVLSVSLHVLSHGSLRRQHIQGMGYFPGDFYLITRLTLGSSPSDFSLRLFFFFNFQFLSELRFVEVFTKSTSKDQMVETWSPVEWTTPLPVGGFNDNQHSWISQLPRWTDLRQYINLVLQDVQFPCLSICLEWQSSEVFTLFNPWFNTMVKKGFEEILDRWVE